VLDEYRFDFYRINILAARDDEILLSIDDVKEACSISITNVACRVPAVGNRLVSRRFVLPIAGR